MSDLGIDGLQHGRRVRHKHGRGCLAVLMALAVVVGLGVFAYVKGVDVLRDQLSGPEDYTGEGRGSVVIEVKDGDTATDIGQTLYAKDVVKSAEAFTDAAKLDERSLTIQVGFYELRKQMSAESALKLLLEEDSRVTNLVTVPEGLRAKEVLAQLAGDTDFSKKQLQRAYAKTDRLGLPSYAGDNAEGYLFPATYDVNPNLDPLGLLQEMTGQFASRAKRLDLAPKARRLQISPADVVTVASLVQSEASRTQDMPKVARVIYNRLDDQMPLQMDSTLHYAAGTRGDVVAPEGLREIDSPYNTYTEQGLPPTPISQPGADALEAALNPADGDWRYFVTVNLASGETRFADTLPQHERNVEVYNEYCRSSDEC